MSKSTKKIALARFDN